MEDNAHLTADAIRPSAGSAGSSSTQEISAVGGGPLFARQREISPQVLLLNFLSPEDQTVLSRRSVFRLWQESPNFTMNFARVLRECRFAAFFWETPPVNNATLDEDFECVRGEGGGGGNPLVGREAGIIYSFGNTTIPPLDFWQYFWESTV